MGQDGVESRQGPNHSELVGQGKGFGVHGEGTDIFSTVLSRALNSASLFRKITLAALWRTGWKGQWLQGFRRKVMWLEVGW